MSRIQGPIEPDDLNRRPTLPRGVEARAAPPRALLEVRLSGGAPTRRLLTESHVVLGRIPGVGILLDHHTVSRRHAEMFCDPFGRFWIRDLGSTNGTTIGGEPISERVLSPGDTIGIGDFSLQFSLDVPADPRDTFDLGALEDERPTAIRKLLDLEPPRIAAAHLRTLLEFSRRLIGISDPVERREALCDLIVRGDFHGTMAVVLRLEGRRSRMVSRPHRAGAAEDTRPTGGTAEARPYISRRVLDMLRESREAVLATNVESRFFSGGPAVDLTIAREVMELWVIAVPFRMVDEALDVLYATVPRDCGSAEWLSLYALAAEVYVQGEASWAARRHAQAHAAIERELVTARQIQRGLVPGDFAAPGLDVTVGFDPCKWVGGDYVDVVPLSDGRVLLTLADVCGKGLQAALVGSSLHTMVRAAADADPPLAELIERVNRHLCEWLPEHSFVTMVAVAINLETGEIECVNAGHLPVLVVSADGAVTELPSAENPALGIAIASMTSQTTRLGPGDVLAMYTDGLTELSNPAGDMLGAERLSEALRAICVHGGRHGVAALRAALGARLDEFREGQVPGDDRTFLLAQKH